MEKERKHYVAVHLILNYDFFCKCYLWPLLETVRFNFKSNINKIKYLKEQFLSLFLFTSHPPNFP